MVHNLAGDGYYLLFKELANGVKDHELDMPERGGGGGGGGVALRVALGITAFRNSIIKSSTLKIGPV